MWSVDLMLQFELKLTIVKDVVTNPLMHISKKKWKTIPDRIKEGNDRHVRLNMFLMLVQNNNCEAIFIYYW